MKWLSYYQKSFYELLKKKKKNKLTLSMNKSNLYLKSENLKTTVLDLKHNVIFNATSNTKYIYQKKKTHNISAAMYSVLKKKQPHTHFVLLLYHACNAKSERQYYTAEQYTGGFLEHTV